MSGDGGPDDRWQQVFQAFEPERNIRAFADLMNQAATASEQVVGSVTQAGTTTNDGPDRAPLRDAFMELEQSFARVYEAVGRFMAERPLAPQARASGNANSAAIEIAVVDGVGTTVVSIADADDLPHCGPLRSHDGTELAEGSVAILRSRSFDDDEPTFVLRADVPPTTPTGVYHGQLLVAGLAEHATPITVRVLEPEA